MATVGDIGKNTLEDFNDELITGIAYKYGNVMFKPLEDKLTAEDDSVLNDAFSGALNTLKFSIMNAVIISVTEYASIKMLQAGSIIFAYAKSGRIVKILRNAINRLDYVPIVGRTSSKLLRGAVDVVAGDQNERLALAKMANDNVNNLASIVAKERHNQIIMKKSNVEHFDNTLKTNQDFVKEKFNQKRELFNAKFKSASWQLTNDDEKLYTEVTGYNFKVKPQKYTKDFVDKLNAVSDVAKDVEGNIINAAQSHVDYITTLGFNKVR